MGGRSTTTSETAPRSKHRVALTAILFLACLGLALMAAILIPRAQQVSQLPHDTNVALAALATVECRSYSVSSCLQSLSWKDGLFQSESEAYSLSCGEGENCLRQIRSIEHGTEP